MASNDTITILRGAERVRRRPAVLFGADGQEGATNALVMLLRIFIGEAASGNSSRIAVTLCADDTICVASEDRGFALSEEQFDQKPLWYYDFCELYDPTEDSSDLIGKRTHKLYDEPASYTFITGDPAFDLTCVQYASAYMHVRVSRNGMLKQLAFQKGICTEELTKTPTAEAPYTALCFKPDTEVFGTSRIFGEVIREQLQIAAVTVPGLLCEYTEEAAQETQRFCYPCGIAEYAASKQPGEHALYCKEISTVGKDRYDRAEYRAEAKIALYFCRDAASVTCLHNHSALTGGTHLQAVTEKLQQYMSWSFGDAAEELLQHLVLVLETKCDAHMTRWANGAQTALNNRMLTDMAEDLIGEDFRQYLKEHRGAIEALLDKVK